MSEDRSTSIGVIVARFQVAYLTEGHREILDYVLSKKHNQNVIFLGVTPLKSTKNNPLDYDTRRRMIEGAYPGKFTILYQRDTPTDEDWSDELDAQIELIANGRGVVLYGSRDSFADHYTGRYMVDIYNQKVYCSGTEQRAMAGKIVQSDVDWRMGCIYASQNRYPTVYPTVDVAIFDEDMQHIYMAKKKHADLLCFVGGFADPGDDSYDRAAMREVREETGLEVTMLGYIGSSKIDDWRYRAEEDRIITNFFAAKRIFGAAKAQDDIAELHTIEFSKLTDYDIIPEHRVLFRMLCAWYKNRYETNTTTNTIKED